MILADGVNPNYIPEPTINLESIPAVGGEWNDDCEDCNEEIKVDQVYLNTILTEVTKFVSRGNSGSGEINIDGVMNVKIQIEIL